MRNIGVNGTFTDFIEPFVFHQTDVLRHCFMDADEPFKPIAPEEEWNRLKHNDTYKTSKERLNNFFDVKEEDNIPACGEQCEIIKEFCYKED